MQNKPFHLIPSIGSNQTLEAAMNLPLLDAFPWRNEPRRWTVFVLFLL